MTTRLKDKLNALDSSRRKKVERRAKELIAEELSLRDLRQAHELTQERVAEELGIGQEGVSRLEQRTDLLVSTLRGYVEAMGGRLRLIAEFPGQPPVELAGFADLDRGEAGKHKRRGASRKRRRG